jgi:hypothetical protein
MEEVVMTMPISKQIDPADLFTVREAISALKSDRGIIIPRVKRLDGETIYFWNQQTWHDEHEVPDHRYYSFRLRRETAGADLDKVIECLEQEILRIEHALVAFYAQQNVTPIKVYEHAPARPVRKRIPLPFELFYLLPMFTILFGIHLMRLVHYDHLDVIGFSVIVVGIVWFFTMRGIRKFKGIYNLE